MVLEGAGMLRRDLGEECVVWGWSWSLSTRVTRWTPTGDVNNGGSQPGNVFLPLSAQFQPSFSPVVPVSPQYHLGKARHLTSCRWRTVYSCPPSQQTADTDNYGSDPNCLFIPVKPPDDCSLRRHLTASA